MEAQCPIWLRESTSVLPEQQYVPLSAAEQLGPHPRTRGRLQRHRPKTVVSQDQP